MKENKSAEERLEEAKKAKEERDREVLRKRFFVKYKELLDLEMAKKDKERYSRKVDGIYKLTKDINFKKNILVCCNREIAREVFLSGFARMDKYLSFSLMGVEKLRNIYMGHNSSWNNNEEDEIINDICRIRGDVLCLKLNYNETKNKLTEDIILSAISSREMEKSIGDIKLHWIFFYGTDRELREKYPRVRAEFMREDNKYTHGHYVLGSAEEVGVSGNKGSLGVYDL